MKEYDFLRLVENIDEKYIASAGELLEYYRRERDVCIRVEAPQKSTWKRYFAPAVCAAALLVGAFAFILNIGRLRSAVISESNASYIPAQSVPKGEIKPLSFIAELSGEEALEYLKGFTIDEIIPVWGYDYKYISEADSPDDPTGAEWRTESKAVRLFFTRERLIESVVIINNNYRIFDFSLGMKNDDEKSTPLTKDNSLPYATVSVTYGSISEMNSMTFYLWDNSSFCRASDNFYVTGKGTYILPYSPGKSIQGHSYSLRGVSGFCAADTGGEWMP